MKKSTKKRKESFTTTLFNAIVTLGLTAFMLWGLQAYSGSLGLKFIQISDIHFLEKGTNTTYKMIGESPKLLNDAIEQINEEKDVDFVMITGDLIDKPFEKELRAVLPYLEKINYPWYFAFGNHDRCVGGFLDTSVYMSMLKNSNPNYKFDLPYYTFSPKKGYKVIVLDTPIKDEVTSQGYIGETQYKWLKKVLDNSKKDTVLIFMHIPIVEPFASPSHRLRNSSQIKALIESYKNPIGVFQGHYHSAKITQNKNVLYVNSPALVSYPDAFRSITVNNYKNKVVFKFNWLPTREKTIQKMAKLLVFSGGIYEGQEKDRTGIYEIEK